MRTSTVLSCLRFSIVAGALAASGCATTTVEPGHRGLYFAPNDGGLRREALMPGKYKLGWCFLYCTPNRVDDFDVTYSTRTEAIDTKSSEGLDLHLKLSVIYKPIESEIYQLDTEIGPNYYDEVIGPEFRSACRGVFARHSYAELQRHNEAIENEVEAEVRRRTEGKHVEISSVTLEEVDYAPEIAEKIRAKIAAEQETARQLAAIHAEAEKAAAEADKRKAATEEAAAEKKLEIETAAKQKALELSKEAEEQRMELAKEAENARFKADQQLAALDVERKAAKAELEVGKLKAQTEAQKKILEARADAAATRELARAHAEEQRAETAGITPMEVMEHAYDALGHLGGTGTTIVLGDWAHVPSFLFPRVPAMQNAFALPYAPFLAPPMAPAPRPAAAVLSDANANANAKPAGQDVTYGTGTQ